jgi:hypothetical protein
MIVHTKPLAVLAFGLLMAASAVAQEALTFEPATLIITAGDGTESEYRVADMGAFLSTSAAYEDMPATSEFSLSLTGVTPIDAELLEWSKQMLDEDGGVRSLTIISQASTEGAQEVRYEVTEADVTSISFAHTNYAEPNVSLSLVANKLTVDGIAMN